MGMDAAIRRHNLYAWRMGRLEMTDSINNRDTEKAKAFWLGREKLGGGVYTSDELDYIFSHEEEILSMIPACTVPGRGCF